MEKDREVFSLPSHVCYMCISLCLLCVMFVLFYHKVRWKGCIFFGNDFFHSMEIKGHNIPLGNKKQTIIIPVLSICIEKRVSKVVRLGDNIISDLYYFILYSLYYIFQNSPLKMKCFCIRIIKYTLKGRRELT